MKPLTFYQRDIIKYLHRKGKSAKEIAEDNDLQKPNGQPIDVRTVRYWVKRLEETGDVNVKPRSGRPRALNSVQEKELVDYIRRHESFTYRKVKRKKHIRFTVRTVNNYALRHRIRAFRAVKKPPLSPENEKQRLDFAKYLISNPDLLDELVFSDEKLFKGGPSNRVVLVRRERSKKGENKAYQPQYVKHFKRPSANADCNIWLYICPLGKGEIFCAENLRWFDENGKQLPDAPKNQKQAGFDNPSYTAMLEKRALPSIRQRMMTCTFIQDNSRVHTSREHAAVGNTTADVLRRHNIDTIDFPPNSPDFHPVEHAHKMLQDAFNKELDRRIRKPKNKADTFALLQYCWYNLVDNQKIVNIYNSMRSKCEKVIQHRGSNNFKG